MIDGKIVGNVMYTKAKLVEESGTELSILTFGPISVHPDYQRRGISRKLLEFSFDRAIALGYKVIVIFGNPDNYVSRGFKSCKKYNVCPAYEFEKADAEKFDEQFEPMKKEFRPSQEEFYIHSHSIIRD